MNKLKTQIKKFWIIAIFTVLNFNFQVFVVANDRSDTVSFIHITDVHICNLINYHAGFAEKRKHFGNGIEPFVNFIREMPNKLNADFLVITGDMTDNFEAETNKNNMLDTEIELFAKHLEVCDVPVFLTLGNHDIASYFMTSETSYSSNQLNSGKARASWIRNIPCFRNGTYYSKTITIDTTTYRLIFLDNTYYLPDRTPEATSYIMDPSQLYWLDNELKKSNTDIEIIFMHIPLSGLPAEDLAPSRNTYHINYQDTIPVPFDLKIAHKDSLCLHSVLAQNSSARLIITGHHHSNVMHDVNFPNNYSVYQLMTGAFGYHPANWRLIKLTANSIIISHPGDVRKQYTIPLHGK